MRDDGIKFAFVEAATNSENFVLAIGHATDNGNGKVKIDLLDAHAPPFSPVAVIKKFAVALRMRGIDRVMGDRHSSRWAKEAFARHSIAYEFCELVRPDLHRDFIALLNAKRVLVPQNAGLQRQLHWFVMRKKDHGEGDDLLTAIAGVSLLATGKCGAVQEKLDYA